MSRDKYKRKTAYLPVRDRVLVVCCGDTEETYFNYYKKKHKKDLNNISVKVVTHKKSQPMAVVKEALSQKEIFDEVWAVFDRDDDIEEFNKAVAFASRSGINCAFSNEAVEYWFLLHFEDRTGAISRRNLNSELSKKLGLDYNKSVEIIKTVCEKISRKLITAEERAKVGYERHILNSGNNPSDWCSCTTIYALTKRLREWSMAKK